MLQRIADALTYRFGWDFVAIVRVERDPPRFVCDAISTELKSSIYVGYGRELGTGVVGQVAATGDSIVLDDVSEFEGFVDALAGVRSEICVPLRHRGQVIAVLNVESLRTGAFHGQLPLLESIADQVAGAVASARLYEATCRRSEQLEVLSEISRATFSGGNLEQQLKRLSEYLRECFRLRVVALMVSDDQGRVWRHRGFSNAEADRVVDERAWDVQEGVVGRAIRSGRPQLVLDVEADADFISMCDGVTAEYAIPLALRQQTVGIVNLEADDPQIFSNDNLTFFNTLADQVAFGIELAVANQRLLESEAQLAATKSQLQAANRELLKLTRTDELTGVANRRHFDDTLDAEWRRARRHDSSLALVLFDIDRFKTYNDQHGHQAGDRALRQIAQTLKAGFRRSGEFVARYGDDGFAAILPGLGDAEAGKRADILRQAVEALDIEHQHAQGGRITLSAGIVAVDGERDTHPEDLVTAARCALDEAKKSGRNTVVARDRSTAGPVLRTRGESLGVRKSRGPRP